MNTSADEYMEMATRANGNITIATHANLKSPHSAFIALHRRDQPNKTNVTTATTMHDTPLIGTKASAKRHPKVPDTLGTSQQMDRDQRQTNGDTYLNDHNDLIDSHFLSDHEADWQTVSPRRRSKAFSQNRIQPPRTPHNASATNMSLPWIHHNNKKKHAEHLETIPSHNNHPPSISEETGNGYKTPNVVTRRTN